MTSVIGPLPLSQQNLGGWWVRNAHWNILGSVTGCSCCMSLVFLLPNTCWNLDQYDSICFWSIEVTRNRWRHIQMIVAGSRILYISTHHLNRFFSSIAFWICELVSVTHSCALPSQEKPLLLNHVTVRIDLETRGSWCSHGWSCRDWVSERPVSSPCALNRVRC